MFCIKIGIDQILRIIFNIANIRRAKIDVLANKAKYIAAIAKAYDYPENLIDISLKPGSTTVIIATFRIQEASKKESLLITMKDEDSSLQNDLNSHLLAQGTGAAVHADGVAHGAVTEVTGKPVYQYGQYLRVDKINI